MSIQTTQDQITASNEILKWLLEENNNFLILDGPAGVGKTYLINELVPGIINQYNSVNTSMGLDSLDLDIKYTSTTNKALSVLTDTKACTIFSLLNLRVFDGKLTPKDKYFHSFLRNTLIIVDESSWVSSDLLYYLIKYMITSTKVLFVMDKYQCPPIKSSRSPVLDIGIREISINEQVRSNIAEINVNSLNMREAISKDEPVRITCGPNIHHLTGLKAKQLIFANKDRIGVDFQIITYTNKASIEYDRHVRDIKGLPEEIQEGDSVIFNRYFSLGSNKHVSADTAAVLVSKQPFCIPGMYQGGFRIISPMTGRLGGIFYAKFFFDKALEKEFLADNPDFNLPDIRSGYSLTVHKTQGNTYKDVFIDIWDINKCRDISLAKKLLYVACSRATDNVYLYGNLHSNIGYIYE